MKTPVIIPELNLKNIIAESREVAQALMVKHLRRIADALDILNAEKLARSKYELGLISKEDYLLTVIKANQKGEEQ